VVPTLAEAVADCQWVIGTSTRPRGAYYWPALSAEQAARETLRLSVAGNRVAIVFGPERTGLSNEHLDHCQALVSIPANKNYSSLNVAQAVQVLAYEVYKQSLDHAGSEQPASSHERNLAPESQLRQLEEHVIRLSHQLGFTDQSGHLLTRFRRIIHRTHLDQAEVNIVRGILATVESAVRRME
jgi:TrmH family RNA methyltransferase